VAKYWREATIGELEREGLISAIQDGNHGELHPKSSDYLGSGVPFVMASNLDDRGRLDLTHCHFISDEQAQSLRIGFAKSGDVLLSHKATMGRVAIVPEGVKIVVLSPQVTYYRVGDENRLSNKFLKYAFLSPFFQHQLHSYSDQSTRKYIGITEQRKLRLLFTDIEEQRSISEVLSSLDEKIEVNRRVNFTLEAIARAIFTSWFVEFYPIHAKAAGTCCWGLPAELLSAFPKSFYDSSLGKVPKDWRVGCLEEVLTEIETGSRPKGGVSAYAAGVPSVGAENILGLGQYNFEKTKYVPRTFYDEMKKGRVISGDVLLYKDGGKPGEYEPHVSLFGNGFPFHELCINEHVYRLRAKHPFGQELLYFWLTSDMATDEMRQRGTGVAIPGLNSTAVKSISVLIPPEEIATAFCDITSKFINAILSNCTQSRTLATLRDSLLPKLMSGTIRVRQAEALIGARA
jgi:type I restriction enzyme, S subunit